MRLLVLRARLVPALLPALFLACALSACGGGGGGGGDAGTAPVAGAPSGTATPVMRCAP